MSEITFYEDSIYTESMSEKEAYDRSKLKLDFGSASAISASKRNAILETPTSGALLQSPDLMLLKLGSPELENLIMQNNGLITTTPTPTDSSISDQSTVEEREQFAAGFVRALQKLQQNGEGMPMTLSEATSYAASHASSSHAQYNSQGYSSQDVNANTVSVKKERNEAQVIKSQTQGRPNSGLYPPPSWVKSDASGVRGGQTSVARSQGRQQVANRPACVQSDQNQQRLSYGITTQPTVVRYPQNSSSGLTSRNISSTASVYSLQSSSLERSYPQSGTTSQQSVNLTRNVASNSPYPVISSIRSASSSPKPPAYKLEDEAQIVPSNTPPLQSAPIDLKMQEIIKHERKKLRNRLAAQRCRKRKIEREEELKDKVKDLKMTYNELTTTRSELRKQAIELKQKVMNHVKMGCQVFLPNSSGIVTEGLSLSSLTEL